MFPKRMAQLCVAALGVALMGGIAGAQTQTPSPLSDVGGRAGRELGAIYRSGVGTGYSSASLNQIALRNAQGYLPDRSLAASSPSGPSSLGLGGGPRSKPFAGYSPSPTTSPYLNLFREDFDGNSDFNYNTLVRPMLQQQQFNEQIQRQGMELSRRLQSIAAQPDFNPQGSTSQYPTGHKTLFNYLGRYYPQTGRQR